MPIDDSFKKPGAVPFKWEIRPGVPKLHNHLQPPSSHRPSSLKPPPSSPSFSASPRTQSSRFHFDKPMMGRPDVVSLGCFQTRKGGQKKTNKLHADPVYKSDIETLSQWSMSTQNSRSPFYNSPRSSSFSSYRSSPWMASDVEWAGYGLF
ncbi:hypothetical protein L2E82_15795 [Cichorium intybus]|uniref:Uncharacterized protein n=1 Tax=Cichorium intybus TaxID=13427 RepID=A0ACB9F3R5_CICIN|nr:hypothetical protein L1887_35159 [Cichorium endivia]KAI3765752.1 hypothetical protein L2E82_15795 [Cichorium intybus]